MINKSEIGRATEEMKAGIEETAAAYAVENRYKGSLFSKKSFIRLLGLKNMFIILIFQALILSSAWVFTGSTLVKKVQLS